MASKLNKKELEYVLELVLTDMEKLEENMEHDVLEGDIEELEMIQDLLSKLVQKSRSVRGLN
tara:strand:- start:745 stop:930 length:186 start_codon:yes stop_codon:yes gene_type:complete